MNYDIDDNLQKVALQRTVVDALAESQVALQLLVKKGLVTAEEIKEMREKVKNADKYKQLYEGLDKQLEGLLHYKENPEQMLKDMLNAKLNGKI